MANVSPNTIALICHPHRGGPPRLPACYVIGYRAGLQQSPLRKRAPGQVLYALGMYQAAEATNWSQDSEFRRYTDCLASREI